MSSDEEDGVNLPQLYKKAANCKRALTRVKKEFENALKALTEASSSQYFFDELIKVQDTYKERRKAVFEIYDTIEDEVSHEKFTQDYGRQIAEIQKDNDVLEEQARLAITAHHNAVTAISASISHGRSSASRSGGVVGSPPGPPWKLQSSFQPSPSLKLDMSAEDSQNWQRQFKIYYDISHLKHADIDTQRAVLMNCLHPDLQVKIYEGLSGMVDIEDGIALIQDEIKKRNPRVVRRHHLFSLEQKKDEHSFSDTVTRMETLAKNADLTDMTKDSILCHLMLRACQDDDLRTKLLEIEEADMTVHRLKEVIQRFEMIQTANKGLNKKEMARRATTKEGNICYRCQQKTDHQAWNCPVDAKTLFCQICHEAGRKGPHLHNSFPTCKAKEQEAKKQNGEKTKDSTKTEDKSEDTRKEKVKTQRVFTRDLSPAGDPESSCSSGEENVEARRVRARDESPAGSPRSSESEDGEEAGQTDSGWAGTESDKFSADSMVNECNETPSATTENIPASQEESGNKLSLCNPRALYATIIMALLFWGVGFVTRMTTEEDMTNDKIFDPIVSELDMIGFAIILLTFGFMIYYNGIVKKVDRSETVGFVGDFLPKKKTSKRRKMRKMKVKRLKIQTGEGEFQPDAAPSDGDESEA